MTERSRQIIVTLDREIREDDFEEFAKVFMAIKGVAQVNLLDPDEDRTVSMATWRVQADIRERVFGMFFGPEGLFR